MDGFLRHGCWLVGSLDGFLRHGKGESQCTVLPNQICFLTNHNNLHAVDIQLLLLSSNQKTGVQSN